MANREKPSTPEQIQEDIALHPERGMFIADDGRLVPAVRFELKEVRSNVSAEAYDVLLAIWGAKGLDKTDGVRDMVNRYIADLGNLHLLEYSERVKSETFSVSQREVRSKKRGAFKARIRAKKANLGA